MRRNRQPGVEEPLEPVDGETRIRTSLAENCDGLAPVCDASNPRYEPGPYEAECVAAKIFRHPLLKAWKAQLQFKLLPGGESVSGFMNLGPGAAPHAGRNSEYYRAWVIANGSPPRKRQRMSERVFKGCLFEVELRDVKRRFDGREHPEGMIYSTARILRRTFP